MTCSAAAIRLGSIVVLFLGVSAPPGRCESSPAAPPAPEKYTAHLRYRIQAGLNERLAQYFALDRYLKSIGFKKNAGPENEPEDPTQNRMSGEISSANARKILDDLHVKAILLVPAGYALPADGERQVKIQLELRKGLPLARQRVLHDQVRGYLEAAGFQANVGYDHRKFTRFLGTIARGKVNLLLEDLRFQASGWLAPDKPVSQLPLPIRDFWPVTVIEVLPDAQAGAGRAPAGREKPAAGDASKIAANLRQRTQQEQPFRMEVLLNTAPDQYDNSWRREMLEAVPGLIIEGRFGQILTVRGPASAADALVRLGRVHTIRLPASALHQSVGGEATLEQTAQAFETVGLAGLHRQGFKGQRIRLAVIDTDFTGYEQYLGRQLSRQTRYVDITSLSEQNLLPRAVAGRRTALASGTQAALAAAMAAPLAELTLIRVDPEAPYQLLEIVRFLNGERVRSENIDRRSDELAADAIRLQDLRDRLLAERKAMQDDFGMDEAAVKRRQAHAQKTEEQKRREEELAQREQRFVKLQQDLVGLKGIQIVCCGVTWADGHPAEGSSPLTRYLDDKPLRSTLWFQASGNSRRQAWAGLFRDTDGNGVMEFAPAEYPLRSGRWTRELNFLAWEGVDGQVTADLPQAKLRVSMQWREPHDVGLQGLEPDPFVEPLAKVSLVILRQRDPGGRTVAADDFEVVARSSARVQRLDDRPGASTYELALDCTLGQPGRYALRIEGAVPNGTRPAGTPTLDILKSNWEMQSRVMLNVVDESRMRGRAIFGDFATEAGSVGMPADAQQVIGVGAMDLSGKARSYSSEGAAFSQPLHLKPDCYSFADLSFGSAGSATAGTSVAAAFAAGTAASALSTGMPPARLRERFISRPGELFRLELPAARARTARR